MAPRRTEEVFTDLNGQTDGDTDTPEELEQQLRSMTAMDGEATIKDDELEIEDPAEVEEEEGETDPPADDEEEDEEEEDEAEDQTAAPAFDPKDVQLILKDAEIADSAVARAKQDKERAESDFASAKAAMKTAKEAGDTDADIAATEKFARATAAIERANTDLSNAEGQKNAVSQRARELMAKAPKDGEGKPVLDGSNVQQTRQTQAKARAQRPSKLLPKFKEANPWFGNSKYKKQADALSRIDKGLAAEGRLNKDTPEYFAELGKRFNREHPGLYRGVDGKLVATGQQRRTQGVPIPNSGGGGGPAREAATKVKLTKDDLSAMRRFGMDPDNNDHRREWLTSKRQQAGA